MEHLYKEHSLRKQKCLNGDWKFITDPEDKGTENQWYKNFPEDYRYINVPGCWNYELDLFAYRGKAWYLKEFDTDDCYLQISFGAVTGLAKVYLDGELLGEHYGGWLLFEFEKEVKAGKHTLVVLVDNSSNSLNTFPLNVVDWYKYGGITRSVEVTEFSKPFIRKNRISYSLNDTLDKACVSATVTLVNPYKSEYKTTVKLFAEDKLIAEKKVSFKGEETFSFGDAVLEDIKLWDINDGNLYNFRITTDDDDVYEKIGFRKIEAKNQAIYLNNKSIFMKGVNRHEQHPDWGYAVPANINKRDLQIIKNLNCNTIRGSHYPNSHTFLDYLDREGMLFWSEIPMWGFKEEACADELTHTRALKMHEEMIEQYYNHPCIVMWGLHNEIVTDTSEGYELTKKLYNFVKEKDNSRLIVFASNHFDTDICFDFSDVICMNRYNGWYSGKISDWSELLHGMRDSLIQRGQDDKPIIISEFGCPGLYEYSSFNNNKWSMQYQSDFLSEVITNSIKEPGICGTLIWQFCNTASDKDLAKARGFNNKGLVDEYRRPKLSYYTVRDLYKNID